MSSNSLEKRTVFFFCKVIVLHFLFQELECTLFRSNSTTKKKINKKSRLEAHQVLTEPPSI